MPTRIMNAKTSDIVTDARIVCPVLVLSKLYWHIRTEIIEIDGTATAKATIRLSLESKGKNNREASIIKAKGTKKLFNENKEAAWSLSFTICVFISKPI